MAAARSNFFRSCQRSCRQIAAPAAFSDFDAALSGVVGAAEAGDMRKALRMHVGLETSAEQLARSLADTVDVNVQEAAALAGKIRGIRRRSLAWTIALDGLGVILAVLAALLCVHMARAHARAIESYRQLAEDRADELDTFAARMAHDVRTPLTALGLSLQMLERGPKDGNKAALSVRRARNALSQTNLIVDGLLDFARAGARPEPGSPSNVAKVAEEVCAVMQPRADEASAVISVRCSSPSTVACSEGALTSVVTNLIGNALTYVEKSPTREVKVEIVEDGHDVVTTVSDTGPGLPAGADPEELFRPYVRGPDARGKGLGLGLATVKRIVEAHHGQAGVRSTAEGCSFWFKLPQQFESGSPVR